MKRTDNFNAQIAELNATIEALNTQRAELVVAHAEGKSTPDDLAKLRERLNKAQETRAELTDALELAQAKDAEDAKAAENAQVVAEFRALPHEQERAIKIAQRFDKAIDGLIAAARAYEKFLTEGEHRARWAGDPWAVLKARLIVHERIELPEHYNYSEHVLSDVADRYYTAEIARVGANLHAWGLIGADEAPAVAVSVPQQPTTRPAPAKKPGVSYNDPELQKQVDRVTITRED